MTQSAKLTTTAQARPRQAQSSVSDSSQAEIADERLASTESAGRPLRRDAELNRRRILASAREVFGERGLEATLDDIAHHAGLGVGTVYRRFPNKEHLVEAMFVERLEEIGAIVEKSFNEPDAWEGFVKCTYELAELHTADRGLREVLLSNAYGHERVAEAKSRLKPLFEKVFVRAQEAGQLRADVHPTDIPLMQLMLGGVAEYTMDVAPQAWRRCLGLLLDGLHVTGTPKLPLTEPPLAENQLAEVMSSWRCPRH